MTVGTILKSMYDDSLMKCVEVSLKHKTPVYEVKWLMEDGTLSKGSLYIFGSQLSNYIIIG